MHLLRGAVRNYAWGSRTALADFAGRPSPTAHPEAELWLGAHPGDPARLETADGEVSLLEVIRADPVGELGAEVQARFGEVQPVEFVGLETSSAPDNQLPAFAGTAAGCAVTESTGMTADAAGTTASTPSRARPGILGERRRS